MKLLLIRHGMTAGNRDKRYIGRTDEPLCEEGVLLLQQIAEDPTWIQDEETVLSIIFLSPLLRCRQTADILFPGVRQVVIPDLAEMDFGIFEGRAFRGDLEFSPEYSRWLDSLCEDPVPEGESKEAFTTRCLKGFEKALRILQENAETPQKSGADDPADIQQTCPGAAAFVVHGGTIMAIMSGFAEGGKAYYEWSPENGKGYIGEWDGTTIRNIKKL